MISYRRVVMTSCDRYTATHNRITCRLILSFDDIVFYTKRAVTYFYYVNCVYIIILIIIIIITIIVEYRYPVSRGQFYKKKISCSPIRLCSFAASSPRHFSGRYYIYIILYIYSVRTCKSDR